MTPTRTTAEPAPDRAGTRAAADPVTRARTSGSPPRRPSCCSQRGFDRTTVDDVAARAGVGKATVYRRWPSKEDLAVAAMETLYSRGDARAGHRLDPRATCARATARCWPS